MHRGILWLINAQDRQFLAAGVGVVEEKAEILGRVVGFIAYQIVESLAIAGATAGGGAVIKAARVPKLARTLANMVPGLKASKAESLLSKINVSLKVLQKTCFVAGTPILTPAGSQPIESLKPGMTVLPRPEGNIEAPVRPRTVEQVFKLASPVVELHVGGQLIETTAEHPFFVEGKGWVPTNELQPGDRLAGHDGGWTAVEQIVDTGRVETVYNMRVADDHTYFVGRQDWGFSVWAHNAYSVRQAADGAWEVIDDAGNVIPHMGRFADEASAVARAKSLNAPPFIFVKDLPSEEAAALRKTLQHIDNGSKPKGALAKKWGTTFSNNEGFLPTGVTYTEYRVRPPGGTSGPGIRRIVVSSDGKVYYTWTHYGTVPGTPFVRIR